MTDDPQKFDMGKAVTSFSDMRPPYAGRDYHDYGLGWMYRTSDLAAAFALGQLRKLSDNNIAAQKNWDRLDGLLEDTPNLVRSYSSRQRRTNGYAYVLRADPVCAEQLGVSLRKLTQGVVAALKAEGVSVSLANWLLPAHSVFQAKDAFGGGEPWKSHGRDSLSYDLSQWPVAQNCIDTCLWDINNHRPPNGSEQVDALAAAVSKVFGQLENVPLESV